MRKAAHAPSTSSSVISRIGAAIPDYRRGRAGALAGGRIEVMDGTRRERDFEEAVRQAAERYAVRKRRLEEMEKMARKSADHAIGMALYLRAKAVAGRRRQRRYLYSRFGIKVYTRPPRVGYGVVRPDRSPQRTKDRLLRAQAIRDHGCRESLWMALCRGYGFFGEKDGARKACEFAFQSMRQSPALWGFFVEKERDERVREHALAELAGWLDTETRLHKRTREAVGGREEKLRELPVIAGEAWHSLQSGEPFYLPNEFVKGFGERRKKGSLAGRVGTGLDAGGFHFEATNLEIVNSEDSEGMDVFDIRVEAKSYAEWEAEEEASRQKVDDLNTLSALMDAAKLSPQQRAVIEASELRGLSDAEIKAELSTSLEVVHSQKSQALKRLRRASGQ
jgi:hypothetical protein